MNQSDWYICDQDDVPEDFLDLIQTITQQIDCRYLARLLWNRGVREPKALEDLLGNNHYQPVSNLELGEEISLAIQRIVKARVTEEKVAIWGSWQVGSIMTTCVLKEGLEKFLTDAHQLSYHFPDRHLSYFGLNYQGLDRLSQAGITLIITANTGSYNLEEVNYAQSKGIDIIIIDRPLLSRPRAPVVAWVNSHSLPVNHPCCYLPAVALAYKLIEGLASKYPQYFSQPISQLLDLVALGLLADKVNLQGEARYLAKEGIKLIKQQKRHNITKLADNAFQIGDRALDLSYGLMNRIRGVASIYTDISFIINLFTHTNIYQVNKLADQAEKAYLNCLDLVQKILQEARQKIQGLDLSNTTIITLQNNSWSSGLFHLIANNLCQEYGKPLLLITNNLTPKLTGYSFAYIYSLPNLDLSPLVINCSNLFSQLRIDTDGIKIILPTENIPLFQEIIEQKIRYQIHPLNLKYPRKIDLLLKLNELSHSLYQELKLLEPYNGLDNPFPQLLIRKCRLKNIVSFNLKNKRKGKNTNYKKTYFQIYQQNSKSFFDGVWWTHYPQEINEKEIYDLVGQLEYNTERKNYYFRLLDFKKYSSSNCFFSEMRSSTKIVDYRTQRYDIADQKSSEYIISKCPSTWEQITFPYQKAVNNQQQLVLAYECHTAHNRANTERKYLKLMGLLKYLLVNRKAISLESFSEKMKINVLSLKKIFNYLSLLKIDYSIQKNIILFQGNKNNFSADQYKIFQQKIMEIIEQENLSKQYFYQVSVNDLTEEISIMNKYSKCKKIVN